MDRVENIDVHVDMACSMCLVVAVVIVVVAQTINMMTCDERTRTAAAQ